MCIQRDKEKNLYFDDVISFIVTFIILIFCTTAYSQNTFDNNAVYINKYYSNSGYNSLEPAVIEIETDTDSFNTQAAYKFNALGNIRFTQSAAKVGLHRYLLDIKNDSEVGRQLISSLEKKGSAIVWEAARLHAKGDLVLSKNIFGYMDKDNYHSGMMTFNHSALKYIVIDITPITHETTEGVSIAHLKNIMAHESIHALLNHRNLLREYQYGRVLHELFTVFYTNQIRHQRDMPLRLTYGDPSTRQFDELIRAALASKRIDVMDLVADLNQRLDELQMNELYEPSSIEDYGVSKNMLSLLDENGFLAKRDREP